MKWIPTNTKVNLEAIIYPILLLLIMWSVFLMDRYFQLNLYKFGVKPQTTEGLKGIIFMPFIHGQKDFSHIINNSIPIAVLLSAVIYFYRDIALRVVLFVWILGGFLLWYFAGNIHTYHIGMSGVIYGLFGFLLLSGFIRRYLPLQAISFATAFVYGSMIWGIFPTEERVSWEGHLSGFLIGLLLAFAFRKHGPKPPKYRYEIEQEMGIEPPDFEAEWNRKLKELEQRELERKLKEELRLKEQEKSKEKTNYFHQNNTSSNNFEINYSIKKEEPTKKDKPK